MKWSTEYIDDFIENFEENKKIILKRRKIIEEKFGIKKK